MCIITIEFSSYFEKLTDFFSCTIFEKTLSEISYDKWIGNSGYTSANLTKPETKCYFLPAEVRNRQKMFFTHTAGGLPTGGAGHAVSCVACYNLT